MRPRIWVQTPNNSAAEAALLTLHARGIPAGMDFSGKVVLPLNSEDGCSPSLRGEAAVPGGAQIRGFAAWAVEVGWPMHIGSHHCASDKSQELSAAEVEDLAAEWTHSPVPVLLAYIGRYKDGRMELRAELSALYARFKVAEPYDWMTSSQILSDVSRRVDEILTEKDRENCELTDRIRELTAQLADKNRELNARETALKAARYQRNVVTRRLRRVRKLAA